MNSLIPWMFTSHVPNVDNDKEAIASTALPPINSSINSNNGVSAARKKEANKDISSRLSM